MAKKNRVRSVKFNWSFHPDFGEGYQEYCIGVPAPGSERIAVEIKHYNNPCHGEGYYCEVLFNDGTMETVYNLNRVFYETF